MPNDIVYGKTSSDIENVDWSVGTAQLPNVVRFGSSSSQASQNSGDICRICHCESDPQNPLLTPCYCSGSLKYVHQTCLQQWLTASETNSCELCKFPFIMHTKIKPFNEWRSLDMSGVERRRLFCAVLFHCATALCVIWSLCVLIERAAEEVKRGLIGWPFWTKLVVVTVGLTGGVVFMYIQCRQYLHLCHRWRARNRILLIQNAPEKMHPLSPPSPVLIVRHPHMPRNGSSSTSGQIVNNNINRPSPHGQIIANIENNPMHYDRDWTLDDSSQSSFKPCPQGSGSMTPLPFHDSVHNMYENPPRSSSHSTNGSGQDLSCGQHISSSVSNCPASMLTQQQQHQQTAAGPTLLSQQQQQQIKNNDLNLCIYAHAMNFAPNSAVFLENSDILNDRDYPKLYHRHSTIYVQPTTDIVSTNSTVDNGGQTTTTTENLDKLLGKDVRRYSDTRLLKHRNATHYLAHDEREKSVPIFNVTNVLGVAIPLNNDELCATDTNINITDIIFENSGQNFDPLELNIQEMLELDVRQNYNHLQQQQQIRNNNAQPPIAKGRHSLNNVSSSGIDMTSNFVENRKFFKSLPNLSASSENLLQK